MVTAISRQTDGPEERRRYLGVEVVGVWSVRKRGEERLFEGG